MPLPFFCPAFCILKGKRKKRKFFAKMQVFGYLRMSISSDRKKKPAGRKSKFKKGEKNMMTLEDILADEAAESPDLAGLVFQMQNRKTENAEKMPQEVGTLIDILKGKSEKNAEKLEGFEHSCGRSEWVKAGESRDEFAKRMAQQLMLATAFGDKEYVKDVDNEIVRALKKRDLDPGEVGFYPALRYLFDDITEENEREEEEKQEKAALSLKEKEEEKEKRRGFCVFISSVLQEAADNVRLDVVADICACVDRVLAKSSLVPSETPVFKAFELLYDDEEEREKALKIAGQYKERKEEEEEQEKEKEEEEDCSFSFKLYRSTAPDVSARKFIEAAKESGKDGKELLDIADSMEKLAKAIKEEVGKEE